ncbi:interleukin-17 receptor C [Sarcoramphus papa]
MLGLSWALLRGQRGWAQPPTEGRGPVVEVQGSAERANCGSRRGAHGCPGQGLWGPKQGCPRPWDVLQGLGRASSRAPGAGSGGAVPGRGSFISTQGAAAEESRDPEEAPWDATAGRGARAALEEAGRHRFTLPRRLHGVPGLGRCPGAGGGGCPVPPCNTLGARGRSRQGAARHKPPHRVPPPPPAPRGRAGHRARSVGQGRAPYPSHGAAVLPVGPRALPAVPVRGAPSVGRCGSGEAPPRGGRRRRVRTRVSGIGAGSGSRRRRRWGPWSRERGVRSGRRGAGAPHGPGPAMRTLGRLLLLPLLAVVVAGAAGGRGAPHDTLACSQGLACRLLDTDMLCGTEPPGPGHGLALAQLRLEPALRCAGPVTCSPCLAAHLRLALLPGTGEPHHPAPSGIPGTEDGGEGGRWSPVDGAASSQPDVTEVLLLSGHTYASSRCVAVEVRAPLAPMLPGQPLGWVTFRCFEAPLGSELHVMAYINSRSSQRLSQRQQVPDCSWPAAQAAVPQCQVPRLQVSPGPKEVVVEVQGAAAGHSYTLRLYHNQSHGASGPGRTVTASSAMNYSLPADEVLPCLCLQVWPETQDPLRATLCPFSHDAEAWERLWVRSRLVLHAGGQALTCSLSAPCDLPAELVPCWQPAPTGPCQALPGLQQPAVGQGPQEFGGLRPHPSLCVQVWSGGQVRLTQCLRDRPLPGRPDDLLLLEHRGNASLCVLERGACTPLASFTSTGAGRPGLLEQELRRDVAAGQCRQVWHPENSTGVALWACPLHKYLRARWALAWMGVLLGAACLLLLLLLKKEDVKGWLKSLRADHGSEGPLRGRQALLVHAAEPAAEQAACALMAALRPLGLAVVAAPGGGSGVAAWGPLPWLHAQHRRALHDRDTIILLLSPAAVAAAHRWDAGAGAVPGAGAAFSGPGPRHGPSPNDVPTVAPCEAFAAALSCAVPALAAGNGHYVVVRLEALVPAVPPVLRAAPAFALPSETEGFLRALAGPGRQRGRWPEPYVAAVAEGLRQSVGE